MRKHSKLWYADAVCAMQLAFSDCGAEPLGVRLVQFMNDSLTMLVLFDDEDAAKMAIEQMK